MLKKLSEDKRNIILDYCLERFGISKKYLEDYNWYIGSKNRIYIGPEELERIRPESIGLCIFRIDKTPKPKVVDVIGIDLRKPPISHLS